MPAICVDLFLMPSLVIGLLVELIQSQVTQKTSGLG